MHTDSDQLELVDQQAGPILPAVEPEASVAAREEKAYRGLVRWWAASVCVAAAVLAAAVVGLVISERGGVASAMCGFVAGMMACSGLILTFVRGFISSAKPAPRHSTGD